MNLNDDIWSLELTPPDIWWTNNDGSTMEYRCRDGVWTWMHRDEGGSIIAEGEGRP